MSSLAASQADGYYHPPQYFTSNKYKSQSLNQFQNSKGHNQFTQRGICRFELPFDGFCTSCGAHAGKGTRFNAAKKEAGNYFTTKIYEFATRCRACSQNEFVIRTNPKEHTFDYVSGIKKKVEEWDPADAGTLGIIDTEIGDGIVPPGATADANDDPIAKMQKSAEGERRMMTERDRMEALIKLQATHSDDFRSNSGLRATFRAERKAKRKRVEETAALGLGKDILLGEVTDGEIVQSKLAFQDSDVFHRKARQKERKSFRQLRSSSIFASGKNPKKKMSRKLQETKKRSLDISPEPAVSNQHILNVKRESVCDEETQNLKQTKKVLDLGTQPLKHSAKKSKDRNDEQESSLSALALYASDSD